MSHAKDFGRESGNEEAAEQLVFDYRTCEFGEYDTALCQYAVKLTLTPEKTNETDVSVLKQAGLDDEQITVAVQVISYFNYINRIADGLGVDLEDWMSLSEDQWRQTKPQWRTEKL